ncbi:TVP38/TMEM64 family protein [Ahniella affigens]|nr:VTT domain-containing protein [Ahniella affigens]
MPDSKHHLPEPLDKAIERIGDARDEARELAPLVERAEAVSHWQTVKRFWPLLLLATIAILVLSSGVLSELTLSNLEARHVELLHAAAQHPVLIRMALLLAIVSLIVTSLPGTPVLAMTAGLLFGIAEGALWSIVGDTLGALALFLLTRRSVRQDQPSTPGALIQKLKAGFASHPNSYALFLRLVPVFPFSAVSIALAWLGCHIRTFIWTTALGVAPSALVYAAIGDGFESALKEHRALTLDLLGEPRFLIPLIAIGVLALLPVLLGLRGKKQPPPEA